MDMSYIRALQLPNSKTLDPKFLSNRFRLMSSYYSRNRISKGFPQLIHIEPTNVCNLKCAMCPREYMDRPLKYMEMSLFKKIVDELAENNSELIYLHLFGEPFLHPKIFEMIDYCKKKGLHVAISTNATVLDKAKSKKLVKSKLDNLIFSFDAAGNPDLYSVVRKGGDYHTVEKNIYDFLEARGSSNLPYTILQSISMKKNEDNTATLKSMFQDYRITINNKPYDEWGGRISKINKLNPEGRPRIASQGVCEKPWRLTVIHVDGHVVPCSKFYDHKFSLGKMPEETLKEIWNGVKMREFRRQHLSGRTKISYCNKCCYRGLSRLELIGFVLLDTLYIERMIHEISGWRVGKRRF